MTQLPAASRPYEAESARMLRLAAVAALLAAGGAVAALSVYVLRIEALLLPAFVCAVLWLALSPRTFALGLLVLTVAIEPGAIDVTRPLSVAWYEFPPGIRSMLPLTSSPAELLLIATAGSLALRERPRFDGWASVPRLVYAVPVLIVLGTVYGVAKGGPTNLAYHELRGLISAVFVFFITLRLRDTDPRLMIRLVLGATTALALVVFVRYFADLRGKLPVEYFYAHEDVLFLTIGAALSGILLLRSRTAAERLLYSNHALLMLAATAVTSRRSGTLALLIMGLVVLAFLFTKRPVLAMGIAVVVAVLGAAYLGTFWDRGYGALAQPARAVRSQVAPNARDDSSDTYREIERRNLTRTIEGAELTGIGFGRPFTEYEELPSLLDRWRMQYHTPHDNILWLWLKMGIVGVAVFLGLWIMALSRCILAFRLAPRAPMPILPVMLAVILLIYFGYNQVDIGLVSMRPIFPLAAAMALALTLPLPGREPSAQTAAPSRRMHVPSR